MGIIRRLILAYRALTQGEQGIRTYILPTGSSPMNIAGYSKMVMEAYTQNSDVRAVIDRIAVAIGGISWIVRKRVQGANRRDWPIVADHPFLDLWNNPNPLMSQAEFIDEFIGTLILAGEVFVKFAGPFNGPPREMWFLRPDRVTIKQDGNGNITGYEYKYALDKPPEVYDVNEIGGLKFWNPLNPLRGLSPLISASIGVDMGNKARLWNINLLDHGGVPPGILGLVGGEDVSEPTEEQIRELKRRFKEQTQGIGNVGEPLVLGKNMTYTPYGLDATKLGWADALKLSTLDICKVLGYPPILLGHTEDATYANYAEAHRVAYTECILPLADRIRDAFNRWLMPRFGSDVWLDYDSDDIEALAEDRDKLWMRVDASKEMTINEKRIAKGLPPFGPEGDVLILSPSDMPISPNGLSELAASALDVTMAEDIEEDIAEEKEEPERNRRNGGGIVQVQRYAPMASY